MSERDRDDAPNESQFEGKETEKTWILIHINGQPIKAEIGVSLSTVLWTAGIRTLRHTDQSISPRGIFCGMGVCFDCLVMVNGKPKQRACLTIVEPGMQVRTEGTWPLN